MKPSRLLAFVISALSIPFVSAAFVNSGAEPWLTGWNKLINSTYAQSTYTARPVQFLCRGAPASCTQNYPNIYRDAADAGERLERMVEHADGDLWHLASGLYGYQLANAAEILRDFEGFTDANMTALVDLLVDVFYPMNHRFFVEHNDTAVDHYALGKLRSLQLVGDVKRFTPWLYAVCAVTPRRATSSME
ncbi:hypothetical protein LXA43DRAFT_1057559 [Ganoderma leucocontextum]|nr:hypothetical protein LXA43DRAFT_1057559 [Ganoderma leucocontextum]